MEITAKKINLLRLWVESFSVVNRCTGKLVMAILCSVLLLGLAVGVVLLGFGTSALLAHFQMAVLAKSVGFVTLLIYFICALLGNCYSLFFMTVCWQIVAAEALGQRRPLSEFFSGSILPTLYQVVAALLLMIPYIVVVIVLAFLTRVPFLMILVMIAVGLLAVRICYSFIAIAVANKGPIEGLQLSWQMTTGMNYVDALLMCVTAMASVLLVEGVLFGIGYALYVNIPLHFAQGFSLAHLSFIWYLAGFVLAVILLFVFFALMTFPVLVFLNRYAPLMPNAQNKEDENIFIPLPELELPQGNTQVNKPIQEVAPATPEVPQDMKPLEAEPQPSTAATQQSVPPPPPAPAVMQGLEDLQVMHASVHTGEEDVNEITQHLNKVYTPKQEHLVQAGDEDRMPTILFDDEMAKELLKQTETPSKETKAEGDSNPPQDDGPIKMSK